MKKGYLVLALLVILVLSWWFYQSSKTQSVYLGLPTVSCIDPTQSIREQFTFNIKININGKNYPLSPTIGHDPAECLREIYTNDSSGLIYVQSNSNIQFNLGEFFDVWRKTFNSNQLFDHEVKPGHTLQVLVNGQPVDTSSEIPLTQNSQIEIIYR